MMEPIEKDTVISIPDEAPPRTPRSGFAQLGYLLTYLVG